jgi:hypothetical protein
LVLVFLGDPKYPAAPAIAALTTKNAAGCQSAASLQNVCIKRIAKCVAFQAEFEGSILFTRSKQFQ